MLPQEAAATLHAEGRLPEPIGKYTAAGPGKLGAAPAWVVAPTLLQQNAYGNDQRFSVSCTSNSDKPYARMDGER